MTKEGLNWWEKHQDLQLKTIENINIHSLSSLFFQDCIERRQTFFQLNIQGYIESEKELVKLFELYNKEFYCIVSGTCAYAEDYYYSVWVSSDVILQIGKNNSDLECTVTGFASSKELFNNFQKTFNKILTKKTLSEHIYVAIQSEMGLRLQSMGLASSEFKETNYSQNVLEKYRSAVEELKSPAPHGRLVILDGPPGVGKSFMVRSMIKELNDGLWIFIPSEMVASVAGPGLIPVLLREKENKKPIFLVVEDADECLVKRDANNFSAISALLNISSGMLGDMIDIRVICTTNTPANELDDAVWRDGRLLERIEFTRFNHEEARVAYEGIAGKQENGVLDKNKDYTLANLYSLIKKGKTTGNIKKSKTGFI